MYTEREDRRGDDRRAAPRGDRPYGRRIDCAEDATRTLGATPARGGRPAPEAWAAHDPRS
ncbi:MAG TPA: hypothetical protein VK420_14500 [Longimicrobium sp.]|nr:hypothetical protein [Longimicrobium sp.]